MALSSAADTLIYLGSVSDRPFDHDRQVADPCCNNNEMTLLFYDTAITLLTSPSIDYKMTLLTLSADDDEMTLLTLPFKDELTLLTLTH